MPEPSVRVTLQPLLCEVCGAAVSLGQEDETRCTHCGATRSVPQDYRRLRDAGALARGDRDALDELYARMTRPPGPLASAWMAAGSWATVLAALGTLVLTVLLVVAVLVIDAWKGSGAIPGAVVAAVVEVVVAVPASFEWLLHTVCGNSFDVADALGPYTGAALGTLVYVLVGVPGSVGWFFEESTEGVAALRREMAATPPPAQPGGPATCRECGAALDVPAGALGSRCLYCRTDNLIFIAAAAVAGAMKSSQTLHRQVSEAVAEHERYRIALRSQLPGRLAVWLFVIPLAAGLGLLAPIVTSL